MKNHNYVVMLTTGQAASWQQVPVAVFEDIDMARKKVGQWNKCARDFNEMFTEFPHADIDTYWLQDLKFELHETAVINSPTSDTGK